MTETPALFAAYKARRAANPRISATYALHLAKTDRMPIRPRLLSPLGHGDVIRFRDHAGQRQTAVVAIVPDSDTGAPWEENEGHGPVTDWTRRSKRAGELVLNRDGDSYRFYDYAEACKIALRDGWNAAPYDVPGETPRQRAARAAMADYEHLRRWCTDQWHWAGVCLFLLPRDGVERDASHIADAAPFGVLKHAALWGIESDSPDYHSEVAAELISELA